MKTVIATIVASLIAVAGSAHAEVRVGFSGPFSGGAAIVGQDQLDGFRLAYEQLDKKFGGKDAALLIEDDQSKPQMGNQIVRQFIERDEVHAVAGLGFSNVMMASLKPIVDSGIPAISTNAATSVVAGAGCAPNLFAVSWQNDGPAEAAGQYVRDAGFENVFLLAPNYQAGKDMFSGFKRFYDKPVLDEVYTQVGQTDYSVEIAQIQMENPDAVFIFYPGSAGINFVKQFSQAGLNGKIPLFSVFTIDGTSLPALREYANGAIAGASWDASLDNPQSKQFVKDFKERYGRIPSQFAAAGFDAAMLLDAAVKRVGDDYADREKLAAAIKASDKDFTSLRGDFRFNNNNMPIHDYYMFEVVDGASEQPMKNIGLALDDHADAYASECKM